MSVVDDFAEYWISQSVHELSPLMQSAFEHALEWFIADPRTHGFNLQDSKPDLDDGSPFGVAKQFYWYFETHFYKAQKTLHHSIQETNKHHNNSWINQPYLCVLDIGCGAGAATFALLDLISAYHDFRIANGHTLYELSISIAVIDPCAFALKALQQVAKYLEPELARKGIHLTIFEVIDEFPLPGCISKIIDGSIRFILLPY